MTVSRVVVGLVMALVVALALHEVISVDLWLHLAAGEWILASRSVPRVDVFSFTAAGHQWVDLHWGYQILVSLAHRIGGGAALQILHGAAYLAAFGILLARFDAERRRGAAVAFCGLVLLVAQERILCRPEAFTVLFLALAWRASEKLCAGERVHPAWLGVQVLWANMQGLFILGPVFMGLRAVGIAIDARLRSESGGAIARRHLVAAALMFCVSVIGPYHIDGLLLPFRLSSQVAGASVYAPVLGELLSPFTGRVVPVLFGVVLGATLLAWLADRERRARDLLPALAFAVLAISARRNLLLFGLLATPMAVRALDRIAARLRPRVARAMDVLAIAALILAIVGVLGGRYYYEARSTKETGVGFSTREYPVGATERLATLAPGGRVYNMLGDGDYLTYHLGDRWSVAFDGRAEVYGEALGRELLRSYTDARAFASLVDRFDVTAIVMDMTAVTGRDFVAERLGEGEWTLRYLDGRAALLTPRVPNDQHDAFVPAAVRPPGVMPEPRPLRPWALRVRFPLETVRHGRALAALGYMEAAAHELGDALRRFPHSADLFSDCGAAWLAAGRADLAKPAFEAALHLDGDLDAAASGLSRALESTDGTAAALAFLDPWAEGRPEARRAWLTRAAVRARAGDLQGAIETLDRARRRISAASVPLARLLLATGDADRAEDVLREHLSGHPEDDEARALLSRLGSESPRNGP